MTDLKFDTDPLFPNEEELRQGIELLFFAYRDFTAEADDILAQYAFGRAHHRVIYFVGRHRDMTVTELLAILRITKQSLSRVLRALVTQGFISQRADPKDGRRRLLALTSKGTALEAELTSAQMRRFNRAYSAVDTDAVNGFKQVLGGLRNAPDD